MKQTKDQIIDYLLSLKAQNLHATKLAILDDRIEDYLVKESEPLNMTEINYYCQLLKAHLNNLDRSEKPQELKNEIIEEILSIVRLLITALEKNNT